MAAPDDVLSALLTGLHHQTRAIWRQSRSHVRRSPYIEQFLRSIAVYQRKSAFVTECRCPLKVDQRTLVGHSVVRRRRALDG